MHIYTAAGPCVRLKPIGKIAICLFHTNYYQICSGTF